MKEKRKGKFIPFASYLRPTEELLWQSSENVDILASVMPTWSLSNFVSLALLLMVVGGCGFMINSKPDAFVGLLGGFIVMIGMGLIVVRYIIRWTSSKQMLNIAIPEQARYAITSERLFYERGSELLAESLDNITVVNLLPNNSLSFGEVFPQWSGLEDAEQVQSIIEQAQKERLEDAEQVQLIIEQAQKERLEEGKS